MIFFDWSLAYILKVSPINPWTPLSDNWILTCQRLVSVFLYLHSDAFFVSHLRESCIKNSWSWHASYCWFPIFSWLYVLLFVYLMDKTASLLYDTTANRFCRQPCRLDRWPNWLPCWCLIAITCLPSSNNEPVLIVTLSPLIAHCLPVIPFSNSEPVLIVYTCHPSSATTMCRSFCHPVTSHCPLHTYHPLITNNGSVRSPWCNPPPREASALLAFVLNTSLCLPLPGPFC